MGKDVYVADAEFNGLGTKLKSYAQYLSERAEEYVAIVDFLKDNAITDGAIHSELVNLRYTVSGLPAEIERVGQNTDGLCKNFLKEIDEADSYLYGAK